MLRWRRFVREERTSVLCAARYMVRKPERCDRQGGDARGEQAQMLFLTLSNAMLDLVMDIIPEDYAKVVADNIDDFSLSPSSIRRTTSTSWPSLRRISSRRRGTPSRTKSSCRPRWRSSRTSGGTLSARTSRERPRTRLWKRRRSVTASTERSNFFPKNYFLFSLASSIRTMLITGFVLLS